MPSNQGLTLSWFDEPLQPSSWGFSSAAWHSLFLMAMTLSTFFSGFYFLGGKSITVVGGDDLYNLLLGVLMSCLRTLIFNGIDIVDFLLESGFLVEDHVPFFITMILFSTHCSRC